jgi:hypothetical protein
MVLHVFSYFLEDLPFLARSIGLTCRHWHDLASCNPRTRAFSSHTHAPLSACLHPACMRVACCVCVRAGSVRRLTSCTSVCARTQCGSEC